MGGRHFRALIDSEVQPIPLSQALSTVQQTIRELNDKANLLAYGDAVQLEALAVGAVVLASHSGGFAGMRFDAFFGALLYELGMRTAPNEPIVFPVASVNDMIVPFLSPPNVEWPCFLPAELNLGNLAKMMNNDGAQLLVFNESVSVE
uniref:Uncharacterized protein n=1 Tax=Globisporangium ultimum (strain ATCC 200006 / CBS 805.95 / DAOM BR144) TaxID=431595 RepID=K3X2Q2_GLOUD